MIEKKTTFVSGLTIYLNRNNQQHEPIYSENYIPFYWELFFLAAELEYVYEEDGLSFKLDQVNHEQQMNGYLQRIGESGLMSYQKFLTWLNKILQEYSCEVSISGLESMFLCQDRSNPEDFIMRDNQLELLVEIMEFDLKYYVYEVKQDIENYDNYLSDYGEVPLDLQGQEYLQFTKARQLQMNQESLKVVRSQLGNTYFKFLIPVFLLGIILLLFSSVVINPQESKILKGGLDTVKAIFARIVFGSIGIGSGYIVFNLLKEVTQLKKRKRELKAKIRFFKTL
ncbi:hypothetical protein [Enterococcus sp. HY326]|uniref:hypothetical protein n=1 Tax=Enterococcus sp. HY326 TaxID=2971265 RepID=UPI00223F6A3B|nr:hypothetical protein [Enterococcus sp. HY326]